MLFRSDLMAHDEAAEHLRVHTLERVGTEDSLIGAGVDVVRVVRTVLELFAVVVASQRWSCDKTTRGLSFGLYEEEVEAFPFV